MTAARAPTDRRRYVFAVRPRCPTCGSAKLMAYRTVRTGDETVTRYTRCASCGGRVIVVLE